MQTYHSIDSWQPDRKVVLIHPAPNPQATKLISFGLPNALSCLLPAFTCTLPWTTGGQHNENHGFYFYKVQCDASSLYIYIYIYKCVILCSAVILLLTAPSTASPTRAHHGAAAAPCPGASWRRRSVCARYRPLIEKMALKHGHEHFTSIEIRLQGGIQ